MVMYTYPNISIKLLAYLAKYSYSMIHHRFIELSDTYTDLKFL